MDKTSRCFCISDSVTTVRCVNKTTYSTLGGYSGAQIVRVSAVTPNECYAADKASGKIIQYVGGTKKTEIIGCTAPWSCDYKEGALWVADGTYIRQVTGDYIDSSVLVGGKARDISCISKNDLWVANETSKTFQRITNGSIAKTVTIGTRYPFAVSSLPNGNFWGIAYVGTYSFIVYFYNGTTAVIKATIASSSINLYGKNIFAISDNVCVLSYDNILCKVFSDTTTSTVFSAASNIGGVDGIMGNENVFWIGSSTGIQLIKDGSAEYTATSAGYGPATLVNRQEMIFYGGM